jgi:hypothetical protein
MDLITLVQMRHKQQEPQNIECYKFYNDGHISRDCRSMMDTSIKENNDIKYKKVYKIKKEEVNKE